METTVPRASSVRGALGKTVCTRHGEDTRRTTRSLKHIRQQVMYIFGNIGLRYIFGHMGSILHSKLWNTGIFLNYGNCSTKGIGIHVRVGIGMGIGIGISKLILRRAGVVVYSLGAPASCAEQPSWALSYSSTVRL